MGKKYRKHDWNAYKNEYATTDISLRELCNKYKLDWKSVSRHSREDGWVDARNNYLKRVSTKAVTKIANKRADELAGVLDSSLKMRDRIISAMDDPLQFNRYLVTEGSKGGEFHTEEIIRDKVDTKAIKEMTAALKAVESLIRSLNNIPTEAEMQRLQIEREKFELEKEKWEKEKAEQNAAHEVRIVFDTDDVDGWTD